MAEAAAYQVVARRYRPQRFVDLVGQEHVARGLSGAIESGRIGHAYQGVADAWGLGIAKIPAVVVDRRYVVYGEPDVPRAVARINAYRSTQP